MLRNHTLSAEIALSLTAAGQFHRSVLRSHVASGKVDQFDLPSEAKAFREPSTGSSANLSKEASRIVVIVRLHSNAAGFLPGPFAI
jgi:hypothetical protein